MTEHVKTPLPWQVPVRFSRLKLMGQSAKIYRASFDVERPDKEGMRFGRIVHAVTLGGAKVVVFPHKRDGNRWKDFKAAHTGEEIASEAEYKEALRIAFALESHPIANKLLRGEREKEIAWMDGGRACGARVDVLGADFVTDLKTTAKAQPEWFMRNAERMAYHAQMAWYRRGASIAMERPIKTAHIVAVETKFPYEITTYDLTLGTLDNGERLWRLWWEALMNCEATDAWPGYRQSTVEWNVTGNAEIDYDDD